MSSTSFFVKRVEKESKREWGKGEWEREKQKRNLHSKENLQHSQRFPLESFSLWNYFAVQFIVSCCSTCASLFSCLGLQASSRIRTGFLFKNAVIPLSPVKNRALRWARCAWFTRILDNTYLTFSHAKEICKKKTAAATKCFRFGRSQICDHHCVCLVHPLVISLASNNDLYLVNTLFLSTAFNNFSVFLF